MANISKLKKTGVNGKYLKGPTKAVKNWLERQISHTANQRGLIIDE